jgi:hypothetical protein
MIPFFSCMNCSRGWFVKNQVRRAFVFVFFIFLAGTLIILPGSAYPDPAVNLVLTPSHPPENLTSAVAVYSYGEPVVVNITMLNEGPGPVTILGVPPKMGVNHIGGADFRTWQRSASARVLREGESITTILSWNQRDDRGKQVDAGIYTIGVYYLYAPGDTGGAWDMSGARLRTGTATILVVSPEGSLQKHMIMHLGEQDNGVTATLVSLDCNAMKGTASFDVEIPEKDYEVTPRPAGLLPCNVSAYPAATYRIDQGNSREFVGMDFICDTSSAQIHRVHLYFEPLPADAKQMDIHVTEFGNHEGSWDFPIDLIAQSQPPARESLADAFISFLKKLFKV